MMFKALTFADVYKFSDTAIALTIRAYALQGSHLPCAHHFYQTYHLVFVIIGNNWNNSQ
jgi:hypothetical protein